MLITTSLTGCTWFQKMFNQYDEYMQPYYEDMDLAKEYAKQLILAVANDDFETARTYLHPDKIESEYPLEENMEYFENRYNLNFSDGVVIKHEIGGQIAIGTMDIRIDGYQVNKAEYTFGFQMTVGDKDFQLYFIAVRNENGFGIYKITQYRPKEI